MCGRFVGNFSTQALLDELSTVDPGIVVAVEEGAPALTANFNTAPTQACLIAHRQGNSLLIGTAHWGLVPKWAKDASGASKLINARSETVSEKPSFRGLLKNHRAIVPVSGFFEWDRTDPKNKRPYFVPREDGRTMWVAGLWTSSPALEGALSFTMLTRESLDDLAGIHHRSPVQLSIVDALAWAMDADAPLELASIDDPPVLAPYEVGREVNSVRNNGPSLLLPVAPQDPDTLF